MKATIRIALGVTTTLIAVLAALVGVLSFFAEPHIDQGNPPIANIYRFSGGIIMPGTPYFFVLAAVLSGAVTAILYKARASSRFSAVLYWLALGFSTLTALVAGVCAGFLFLFGHKYA